MKARDRVAILAMPVLFDRESQVVVELERHGAHLDDVVVVLRFAFGAFPSDIIDLLLGAALLAHPMLQLAAVPRSARNAALPDQ